MIKNSSLGNKPSRINRPVYHDDRVACTIKFSVHTKTVICFSFFFCFNLSLRFPLINRTLVKAGKKKKKCVLKLVRISVDSASENGRKHFMFLGAKPV